MTSVYVVTVEYRREPWIVQEVDMVTLDEDSAKRRVLRINTDLGTYSNHVAWVDEFELIRGKTSIPRHRPGSGNRDGGSTTLTEDDVREIRRRRAAGEKGVDIAREFGVSTVHVSAIYHHRRWSHVR